MHVDRNRNLHPRLGTLLRGSGELGRAHAKHAVANGDRFAYAQVLRLALEGIGCLNGIGDATLGGPELEQVAHGDVGARGKLDLAGGIPRDASDGNTAIIRTPVAHHVVTAFARQVAMREPTVKRLG